MGIYHKKFDEPIQSLCDAETRVRYWWQ